MTSHVRSAAMRQKAFPGWIAFLAILLAMAGCSSPKEYLPAHFLQMKLVKKLTGAEAKAYVDRLHHREVTPQKNEIGFYEGEGGPAIIYITYYRDSKSAAAEGEKMAKKISPLNSVFIGGQFITVDSRQIYRCFGMGQTHYVFSYKKALFWLSVNTMRSRAILDVYLHFLKDA